MPRFRILVTGRVQGVGFRWFVARAAARHGIAGFVRNEPDGSVYCEAEAEAQPALNAFVADVRQGPPGSRVDDLALTPEPPSRGASGFRIVR